jgi:hypothetical protein
MGERLLSFTQPRRDEGGLCRSIVSLALAGLLSGTAAGAPDCKLSLTRPRHLDGAVATGLAQPSFRSDYRLTFTFWSAGPTARLQVQFTPGSPVRFSPQQIKDTLEAVPADIEFMQVKDSQQVLKRLTGWEFVGNTAFATFELPNFTFLQFGKSFLEFGMGLPQAVKDIHPAGSPCAQRAGQARGKTSGTFS